eukprot:GHUV01054156.1.p1 GENE.GHUV01054156.1~~GHUV01054156.1.p1  ORF type:complete len:104 (+),score=6.92 GHUV01054156.1:234-545(+)
MYIQYNPPYTATMARLCSWDSDCNNNCGPAVASPTNESTNTLQQSSQLNHYPSTPLSSLSDACTDGAIQEHSCTGYKRVTQGLGDPGQQSHTLHRYILYASSR